MCGVDVIKKRFGGWHRAIHAFCQDRNSNGEEERENTLAFEQPSPGAVHLLHDNGNGADGDCEVAGQPYESTASESGTPLIGGQPCGVEEEPGIIRIEKHTPRQPSPKLRFRVLYRDDFTCQACGRSRQADGVVLEVDHIIPYSGLGETVFENLQTLCRECNGGKSNMVLGAL